MNPDRGLKSRPAFLLNPLKPGAYLPPAHNALLERRHFEQYAIKRLRSIDVLDSVVSLNVFSKAEIVSQRPDYLKF